MFVPYHSLFPFQVLHSAIVACGYSHLYYKATSSKYPFLLFDKKKSDLLSLNAVVCLHAVINLLISFLFPVAKQHNNSVHQLLRTC